MNKDESDLIIAEQNKSTEEILKAVAKVKSDYHELCKLKDMRIAELEKENAELKKELVEKGQHLDLTEKEWGKDLVQMYHFKTLYTKQTDQLTKAKELLKQWVELFKPKGGNIPPTPIQVDTEQFLKEVEK